MSEKSGFGARFAGFANDGIGEFARATRTFYRRGFLGGGSDRRLNAAPSLFVLSRARAHDIEAIDRVESHRSKARVSPVAGLMEAKPLGSDGGCAACRDSN